MVDDPIQAVSAQTLVEVVAAARQVGFLWGGSQLGNFECVIENRSFCSLSMFSRRETGTQPDGGKAIS